MIPATGVLPPLLILVIVRAMAPVAGIPPKRGEAILANPCATNSVLESWWSLITPSATVAESRLSMAPRIAMVMAGDTRFLMVSQLISGTCAAGSSLLIEKRSPMVSMLVTPAYCFRMSATTVIRIMAMSEPGIFLLKRGVMAMTITLTTPMRAHQGSMVSKLWK